MWIDDSGTIECDECGTWWYDGDYKSCPCCAQQVDPDYDNSDVNGLGV